MESAEAIVADVDSKRSVTIEIFNRCNNWCLLNPRLHLENGEAYNPPQPSVRPLMSECCTFIKSDNSATGTYGVLMYDFMARSQSSGEPESLAIMFSVPWDYNLYQNWFGVGIYKTDYSCDKELLKEMYYEKMKKECSFVREEATGSGINYVGMNHDIRATMGPAANAIMKVEVWENLFQPMGQQRY